jgi:hypothetical protein
MSGPRPTCAWGCARAAGRMNTLGVHMCECMCVPMCMLACLCACTCTLVHVCASKGGAHNKPKGHREETGEPAEERKALISTPSYAPSRHSPHGDLGGATQASHSSVKQLGRWGGGRRGGCTSRGLHSHPGDLRASSPGGEQAVNLQGVARERSYQLLPERLECARIRVCACQGPRCLVMLSGDGTGCAGGLQLANGIHKYLDQRPL